MLDIRLKLSAGRLRSVLLHTIHIVIGGGRALVSRDLGYVAYSLVLDSTASASLYISAHL